VVQTTVDLDIILRERRKVFRVSFALWLLWNLKVSYLFGPCVEHLDAPYPATAAWSLSGLR
jgi:hypothetical protein